MHQLIYEMSCYYEYFSEIKTFIVAQVIVINLYTRDAINRYSKHIKTSEVTINVLI